MEWKGGGSEGVGGSSLPPTPSSKYSAGTGSPERVRTPVPREDMGFVDEEDGTSNSDASEILKRVAKPPGEFWDPGRPY